MIWIKQFINIIIVLYTTSKCIYGNHTANTGDGVVGGNGGVPCDEARLKCAYRTGCGGALNNYLEGCSHVLQGIVSHCPEHCQYALVALTSTDEGKQLMTCECNDEFCEDTKHRIEICRPQVVNAIHNETVSCLVAQWICAADPQCSTALEYYNRYCKSMFHGKKCTHRCMNSISILRRQEKAAKLNTCRCDGHEQYNCQQIQLNMARLCFHRRDNKFTSSGTSVTHHDDDTVDDSLSKTKSLNNNHQNNKSLGTNIFIHTNYYYIFVILLIYQLYSTAIFT